MWLLMSGKDILSFSKINIKGEFFLLPPPTIVFHIDPVGCVMSVGRTWRHQKTPREKALKHISEVLEYFQLWKKHKLYIFWVRGSSGTYNQVSFIWKWQKLFFRTILTYNYLLQCSLLFEHDGGHVAFTWAETWTAVNVTRQSRMIVSGHFESLRGRNNLFV